MDEMSILRDLVSRFGQLGAAYAIGVTQPTVSRWLSGKSAISPGMKKLIRLTVAADGKDMESAVQP